MPEIKFTEEQLAVLAEARNPQSLLVNALAGAAKTTTLTALAGKLPVMPTLCCAFNKSIAVEMSKRMPSFVTCSTMNSIGHQAWGKRVTGRLIVKSDKMFTILKTLIEKKRPEERKELNEGFASLLRATRLAKSAGYVPEEMKRLGKTLISAGAFFDDIAGQLDVNPTDEFEAMVDAALVLSITQAFEKRIDFDDQIYMSVLFGGIFPQYDTVLVDEAQDLSPMNHMMLEKMVLRRLIAVGDPNQAIYGFRGADKNSMARLKDTFQMKELTLSTSFRCPQAVVRRAQGYVPHMRWPEWAKEGEVKTLESWSESDVPDGAAILCRNNAPLFKVAMHLIRKGRGVEIRGNEIGKALIKLMSKIGTRGMKQEAWLTAIDEWEEKEVKTSKRSREAGIRDRAECLRVFARAGDDREASIAYAEHLFSCTGPVQLMTGHKSKGEEWDNVFHLNSFLIPSKFARRMAEEGDESQMTQERNLRYVIETRSKLGLYFVNSEDMI